MNLGKVTLVPVAVQHYQRRMSGELTVVYEATKGDIKGHVVYDYEWDGRSVLREKLRTDNPALFDDEDKAGLSEESPSFVLTTVDYEATVILPENHPAFVAANCVLYGD